MNESYSCHTVYGVLPNNVIMQETMLNLLSISKLPLLLLAVFASPYQNLVEIFFPPASWRDLTSGPFLRSVTKDDCSEIPSPVCIKIKLHQ